MLFRDGFSATSMSIVGTSTIGATGLYPSDHAGVVATLTLTSPHAALATPAAAGQPLTAFYASVDQELGALSTAFSDPLVFVRPLEAGLDTIDQIFADMA